MNLPALRAQLRDPSFRQGASDMLGAGLGVGAWGLVTGVAMVKGGMSTPLALFMSLTVYAGSAQLAVLPLMAAGAPPPVTRRIGVLSSRPTQTAVTKPPV